MATLPLVLCGPIVRRAEIDRVCVWVALKQPCRVEISVFESEAGAPGAERLSGSRHTVRVAEQLHIAAVTAVARTKKSALDWGESYLYNLSFDLDDGPTRELHDDGVLREHLDETDLIGRLCYEGQSLPGFRLPSAELEHVRLFHGSCRKPHGEGIDALRILDEQLAESLAETDGVDPPQQLLLTGDQIYADDVDPGLLKAVIAQSAELCGGEDPEKKTVLEGFTKRLQPGQRQELMHVSAHCTSADAACHLVTLAEYVTMYLFAWSDVFWNRPEVAASGSLSAFRAALPQVRRALANVSTYMIFDDHEVTDDWNRTAKWVAGINSSEIGERVIRNGLVAYALCQHWGNDPAAFEDDTPGGNLLEALDGWNGEHEYPRAVQQHIHIPRAGENPEPVPREAMRWHYCIDTPQYRVVALDIRTRRHYRTHAAAPGLMSRAAIDEALGPGTSYQPVTVVLSGTPVLGVKIIEFLQGNVAKLIDLYKGDKERVLASDTIDVEAWAFDPEIHDYLLDRLAALRRVVVLSGDVHYAFGVSLVGKDRDCRIINFVSSSLHNEFFGEKLSKLLSWIGDRRLEGVTGEEAPPTELPAEVLKRTGSTGSMAWEEEVIPEGEPVPAETAERGDVEFEAFPASRQRADVVGSANLGEVVFRDGKVEHRLRWQDRKSRNKETLHVATLPVD